VAEVSTDERIRTFLTVMPRLLRAERPPAAALRDITEVARSLFDARYSGAALLEDDGSFGAVAFSGLPTEVQEGLLGDRDKLFLGVKESTSTVVEDPSTILPSTHPQVSHLLAAPLVAHHHVIGVLYVAEREDGEPFTPADEQLVETAAGLLGVALSSTQLLRDALHARSWMRAAAGITQELFAGELKQPLQHIADRVHELADADFVGLAVLEDESLVVRHATGPELDPLVVGRQLPLERTTLAERTIRSGRGQVVGALDPEARESLRSWSGIEVGPAMMLPLRGADGVLGVMFVGREVGAWRFTETDVEIAGSFANHAAVAVELANARQVGEQLQLLEERNRIGRDLHDHVVQRLFGTGMSLQRVASSLEGAPLERVSGAITTLDDTIRQIRNTIMSLRNPEEDATLESQVSDILREVTPLLGFNPVTELEEPTGQLGGSLAADLAACVREGLSNIVRHAHATRVEIHATVDGSALVLTLRDNGVGIQTSRRSGLENMKARVRRYGGRLDITTTPGEGTQLCWRVPMPSAAVPRPRMAGR
jgi:two-component system, NarL family, sensor histidine kinase DevS